MLLRLAEAVVFLFLVGWTMVFPLATMLSLLLTFPLFLFISTRWTGGTRWTGSRPASPRQSHT